jgi:hypothetical protein
VLTEDDGSASPSDSGGEMKRAVGRGPLVDGPLVFLRIGGGMGTGFLDAVEDDVVLGRLWSDRLRAVVLEAPGPRRAVVFYDSKFSTAWLMRTGSSYQWRGPFIAVWRSS